MGVLTLGAVAARRPRFGVLTVLTETSSTFEEDSSLGSSSGIFVLAEGNRGASIVLITSGWISGSDCGGSSLGRPTGFGVLVFGVWAALRPLRKSRVLFSTLDSLVCSYEATGIAFSSVGSSVVMADSIGTGSDVVSTANFSDDSSATTSSNSTALT